MTNNLFRNLFILLFIIFFLPGCIYEDMQSCIKKSDLRFFYTMNPENKDLLGETVSRIDVYIFDKDSVYIGKKTSAGDPDNNQFPISLDLPDGIYNFLSVGYQDSYFMIGVFDPLKTNMQFDEGLIAGKSTLKDFRLKATYNQNLFFPIRIGNLLRGNLIRQELPAKENASLNVSMIQFKNQLNITIKGLDYPGYHPILYANNGRYDFENNIPSDARNRIYEAGLLKSVDLYQFEVLRLIEHQKIEFMLVDANGNKMPGISPVNLIELIQKSPSYATQEELDREHSYNIELNYHQSVIVGITVNGWETVQVKPEM